MVAIRSLIRLCFLFAILSTFSIHAATTRGSVDLFQKWRQLQGGASARCVVREDDTPTAKRIVIRYYFAIESSQAVLQSAIDELETFLFYILYASILWCPDDGNRLLQPSIRKGKLCVIWLQGFFFAFI
jgi:hypothetical protein